MRSSQSAQLRAFLLSAQLTRHHHARRYTDEGYEDPDADVMGKFLNMFKGKK